MVPPKYFCPSIHRPHSDVPSLQIVMQPIGKPSGKVHASQPILARKPRYPTEKARTGRFSRIEDIRDLGFLSEDSPQTLGNPLDRGTSRGIPRFLCPILPFDVYLFREARRARPAFAASAPIDSRYSEQEESACRNARGATSAGETPRLVALCASTRASRPLGRRSARLGLCVAIAPAPTHALRGTRARPRRRFIVERTREPRAP